MTKRSQPRAARRRRAVPPYAAALINTSRRPVASGEVWVTWDRTDTGSCARRAPRWPTKDATAPQGLHKGVDRATEGGSHGDEILVTQFDPLGRMPVSALLDNFNQSTQRLGLAASGVLELLHL